jgi:hypothetical protein
MVLSTTEGTISPLSLPMGKNPGMTKFKTMLVPKPSVFLDDNAEGWTVVRLGRWSPAIDGNTQDPRKRQFRKTMLWAWQGCGLLQTTI